MEQASRLGEQAEEVARLEGTLASALADRDALRDTVICQLGRLSTTLWSQRTSQR